VTRDGALRDGQAVSAMFDRIVGRYDLMNRVMTGGRDVAWRRLAARTAVGAGANQALDVATGTGDLALDLLAAGAKSVTGIDFAPRMVLAARAKVPAGQPVSFMVGDALHLPFADDQFDACTVSFGLRNMENYQAAVKEMTRVLRPGGRFVCLELTPYRKPVLGRAFALYFNRIVPFAGGLLSGDREAYSYLPASVEGFPDARSLAALMVNAGQADVKWKLLGGGTVALHAGIKRDQPVSRSSSE
jgi:demethylmenaquinone methyltransferase / 2-methoxy-6-polyprenyl-1,4-benzoquinol methylase